MSHQDFVLRFTAEEESMSVYARHGDSSSDPVFFKWNELQRLLDLSGSDFEQAGRELFAAAFTRSVSEVYTRIPETDESRIVLELPLPDNPSAAFLHRIPWEGLHNGRDFLARRDRTPVVRRISGIAAKSPALQWPLRILFTTANPGDSLPLDLESEEDAFRAAVREFGSDIVATVLRNVTYDVLVDEYRSAYRRGSGFHIWHHCGHGLLGGNKDSSAGCRDVTLIDEGPPGDGFELILQGPLEAAQNVGVDRIASLIADNPSLCLVVLNVCFGGSVFGLAPRLASLDVANALAFRRAVKDQDGIGFTRRFYRDLASNPLDSAVNLVRKTVPSLFPNLVHYSRENRHFHVESPNAERSEGSAVKNENGGFLNSIVAQGIRSVRYFEFDSAEKFSTVGPVEPSRHDKR